MDAPHNPHKPRPKGEWIGVEMIRQFWELTIRNASKQFQKRFLATFEESLKAEGINRNRDRIRDIQSYIDVEREVEPAFALLELTLDIPDEVISHPKIQEMLLASIDMVNIGGDVSSYNPEKFYGDDSHNIVTIVMNEIGTYRCEWRDGVGTRFPNRSKNSMLPWSRRNP
ncbi:hypothetical protein HD554DRAFT_806579 [Boletus coccyginus]|nr:hypothetical protein HD554DRAFT_806579 [Boletus coccyginus]